MRTLGTLRGLIADLVAHLDGLVAGVDWLSWTGPRADRFREQCAAVGRAASTVCVEASAVHAVTACVLGVPAAWLEAVRAGPAPRPGAPGIYFHPSLDAWWAAYDVVRTVSAWLDFLPSQFAGIIGDLLAEIDLEAMRRYNAMSAAGEVVSQAHMFGAETSRVRESTLSRDMGACAHAARILADLAAEATPRIAEANAPPCNITAIIAELDRLPPGALGPIDARREGLLALLRPGVDGGFREIVHLSLAGDGLVIEVLGDLATASAVAVVVPGINTTIDNYDATIAANARRLYDAVPGVAVVSALAYNPPGLLGAPFDHAARRDAEAFGDILGALPVPDGADLVLIAHSYGALLATEWLRRFPEQTARLDRVVFVGAAGGGDVATLPPGIEYYEACASGDGVCWEFATISTAEFHHSDALDGATMLPMEGGGREPSTGHSEYFVGASLAALAAVVRPSKDARRAQDRDS